MIEKQLVIIGAGPGGYAAAFYAADHGMDVTLVDKQLNPGGVCLYRGCIPSKALLHAAKLLNEVKEAEEIGLKFSKPKIDLDKLRNWKNEVVEKHTSGLGGLSKQRKINYIQGTAQFKNSEILEVNKQDGTSEQIKFKNVIIATGSVPARIPGLPESERILDSTSALELQDIPNKMLVIGGGYIGLELGSVYASLGSKVTVVEMMPGLLTGADKDMVNILAKRIKSVMENVFLNTKVAKVEKVKDGIKVTFEGDSIENPVQVFDRVLVSVGRRPVTSGLGIEKTNVKVSDKGFVEVDNQLRTADPKIFAIGDIVGNPMLAHKASAEGKTAVDVILGKKAAFEPNAIPAVVFTDPEMAWAGLSETEAKQKGIKVDVVRFSWAASGRATTLGRNDGLTKLIIDPETERVLGVGIVGVGAGEMIAEGVMAVEMAALASDVALSIHAHPTLSETVMEAAEMYYGHSTHIYRPKKK